MSLDFATQDFETDGRPSWSKAIHDSRAEPNLSPSPNLMNRAPPIEWEQYAAENSIIQGSTNREPTQRTQKAQKTDVQINLTRNTQPKTKSEKVLRGKVPLNRYREDYGEREEIYNTKTLSRIIKTSARPTSARPDYSRQMEEDQQQERRAAKVQRRKWGEQPATKASTRLQTQGNRTALYTSKESVTSTSTVKRTTLNQAHQSNIINDHVQLGQHTTRTRPSSALARGGNGKLRLAKNLESTNVQRSRPLQMERTMPQRSHVLKHPIDHCYDVQHMHQNPQAKGRFSKWKTYCPHHTSVEEEKLFQQKGTYIYVLDRVKSKLQITELLPVPKDVLVGAVSGKYHTFWFLRDNKSAVYATSLSRASVGQLGLGYNIKSASFEVPQMLHFKEDGEQHETPLKIACGEMHSLFLTQGGKSVMAAGSNLRGACGLGTSRCIYEATQIPLPEGYVARHVAAGDAHTIIIARNERMFEIYDEVFVMGAARSGALGLAIMDARSGQTEPSEYTEGTELHAKSMGGYTDTESAMESQWDGDTDQRSDYGQQGHNDTQSVATSVARSYATSQIEPLIDSYVAKQSLLTKTKDLLDVEEVPSNQSEVWIRHPQKLSSPQLRNKVFKGVYCNAHNTLLVTKSGEVFGMGSNECGSLGVGHDQPVIDPRVIFRCSTFNSDIITHVACGEAHTLIVTDFRKIFVAGANRLYQLGLHHNIDIQTFTRLNHELLSTKVIALVRCGRHVTVIVTTDNCVFCFGGRFGEFHESRYLELTAKNEQIVDVTIENDTPMLILGKGKNLYI